jgi:hypothetical protein
MGRSQRIKYLRVYLTWVVHSKLIIYMCTDYISHVTCLLFAFECVPNMGRSQQIKYLRLYFNVLVFEA